MSRPIPESPSTVLFDLDGTLMDTAPDFIRCLNQLRARYDMAPLPDHAIRPSVSSGARAMIRVGFELTPEDEGYSERHSAFLDLYEAGVAEETRLFAGMEEILAWLEQQQITWAIGPNTPSLFTLPLREALTLDRLCASVVCPDHVVQRKPHPESLLLACQQMAVAPQSGVYVGDHLRDIQAGQEAGMVTVAAGYGYIEPPDRVEAWLADHTVSDVAQLARLLRQA